VAAAVCILLAAVAAQMVQASAAGFGLRLIVHPIAVPLGLLVAHAFVIAKFEGGNWGYVFLDRRAGEARRWGVAAGLGGAAIAAPSVLLLAVGMFAFAPAGEGSSAATGVYLVWVLVPAALGEELLARGYLFSLLREVTGWRWAIAVTSIAFGLLHLPNPGASTQAIITVVLAGVFLGLVLVRTASLYAAWAAHAAWNMVLAALLHADVSGIAFAGTPDYQLVDTGPDWLTGGRWGPEGGAGAAAGLLLASAVLLRPLLKSSMRKMSGASSPQPD
jgi:membrane protease YdiL (CAAX protease family)